MLENFGLWLTDTLVDVVVEYGKLPTIVQIISLPAFLLVTLATMFVVAIISIFSSVYYVLSGETTIKEELDLVKEAWKETRNK